MHPRVKQAAAKVVEGPRRENELLSANQSAPGVETYELRTYLTDVFLSTCSLLYRKLAELPLTPTAKWTGTALPMPHDAYSLADRPSLTAGKVWKRGWRNS